MWLGAQHGPVRPTSHLSQPGSGHPRLAVSIQFKPLLSGPGLWGPVSGRGPCKVPCSGCSLSQEHTNWGMEALWAGRHTQDLSLRPESFLLLRDLHRNRGTNSCTYSYPAHRGSLGPKFLSWWPQAVLPGPPFPESLLWAKHLTCVFSSPCIIPARWGEVWSLFTDVETEARESKPPAPGHPARQWWNHVPSWVAWLYRSTSKNHPEASACLSLEPFPFSCSGFSAGSHTAGTRAGGCFSKLCSLSLSWAKTSRGDSRQDSVVIFSDAGVRGDGQRFPEVSEPKDSPLSLLKADSWEWPWSFRGPGICI